ncbi:MAG: winged helix DNA-binding protein [Candidatus Omnitrophica bacterium]|nr:winged helix DNA-binding protein [Candidatus Omnitrophota bacterium]
MDKSRIFEFADELNQMIPVIHKEMIRRQIDEIHKDKITFQQLLILEFIERAGQLKMSEIAGFMDVSTAAVTGIVERLVREKYVERVYDKRDRRVIRIRITPKGSQIVTRVSEQRRSMVIRLFHKVSDVDRASYLRIIKQIRDTLLKQH